jgi:hypothetical protein
MAYVTTINVQCRWERCKRTATHRVHSQWNDPCGDYCQHHAATVQAQLQASEDANRKAHHDGHPDPTHRLTNPGH